VGGASITKPLGNIAGAPAAVCAVPAAPVTPLSAAGAALFAPAVGVMPAVLGVTPVTGLVGPVVPPTAAGSELLLGPRGRAARMALMAGEILQPTA